MAKLSAFGELCRLYLAAMAENEARKAENEARKAA